MIRTTALNRTTEVLLTLFAMWPGTSYVLFCRIFWIVTLIITQYCHYHYFQIHFYSNDLFNLMDCLSSFIAYAKVFIKLIMFWLNQRTFMKTLSLMENDWRDCANSEISMRETMCKARLSDRITNAMIILHTMSAITYGIRVFLADVDIADSTSETPYVHKVEFPFDINTKRTYRMVLATQLVYVVMCSWAAGVVNAMLLTLVLHLGGQMDILRYWLEDFASKKNCKKDGRTVVAANEIIEKHQRIISLSEHVENLYMHITLLQFTLNTIMICSLAFLIVKAVGTPDAVEQIGRSLLFYAITNLEAFIFCFAGEYLKNKSKEIGIAAYKCSWYNLKPKENRILLFLILRSQKQLTLTVGKMADLSLEYFTSIMNVSGSFLSMMLAMK